MFVVDQAAVWYIDGVLSCSVLVITDPSHFSTFETTESFLEIMGPILTTPNLQVWRLEAARKHNSCRPELRSHPRENIPRWWVTLLLCVGAVCLQFIA